MPRPPVPLAELAAQVIAHASLGDVAAGDAVVAHALERAADEQGEGAAAFWYSIAVLEHGRGDLGAQQLAAERCLQIALAVGSRGWSSNALSMRAMALARGRDIVSALTDLARAELDVDECHDPGLSNWAHVGLGYCYLELRLYELAEPHLLMAAQLRGASPMPLAESAVIDMMNLSELYLAWADELDRVPGYATADDAARHRAQGRRWAHEAVVEARRRRLAPWLPVCRVLHLSAAAEDHPLLVQPHLRRLLAEPGGHPGSTARVQAALARALRACGDLEQAHSVASAAVEQLGGEVVDWQVEVAVRDLLVSIEADLGRPGAENALAYVRLLGRSSWQQRLRTLQGARTALDVERLQRDGQAAWLVARRDPLTGLGNRRALDEAMGEVGSVAGDRRQHTLLLLDLDDFKGVNDDHGHAVGDAVLCRVGEVLRAHARDGDLVVRLGGDEFVVLAVGAGPDVGAELVRRFERGIEDTDWDDVAPGLRVTATVGSATTGTSGDGPHGRGLLDLVQAADAEMYRHKRRPRERT